jgi:hypothetical protein
VRASPSFHLGRSDRTPHIEAAWSRLPSAIRSQPPGSQVPEESRGADAAARRPRRGFPGPGPVQTSIEAGADHCPSPHGTCGVPKGSQGQEAALIPGRGSGRRPPPHGRRKRMPLSASPQPPPNGGLIARQTGGVLGQERVRLTHATFLRISSGTRGNKPNRQTHFCHSRETGPGGPRPPCRADPGPRRLSRERVQELVEGVLVFDVDPALGESAFPHVEYCNGVPPAPRPQIQSRARATESTTTAMLSITPITTQ